MFKKKLPSYTALSEKDAFRGDRDQGDALEPLYADEASLASLETCAEKTTIQSLERGSRSGQLHHILALYGIVLVLLTINIWAFVSKRDPQDLSLGIWSPAQDIVKYSKVEFGKYFADRSPYLQGASNDIDAKWEDLYNFGLSGLTYDEASKLLDPTAHLPHDKSTYIVTLGVFHQLHCLNHLRKALYPDEHPGLWQYHANGTVDHSTILSLHWDHCLDVIRQALMCQSDITPMPFFYRESDDNIYSSLETTHYCRNFEDIKDWAKQRQVTHWESLANDPYT
ncbi:hypothetical protein M433DRAFT_27669 [Acidomyces richmondensis BFW]|nr:MAG: hypothetical protein FE78DRAFT_38000 [Acidomyces sp. 'richmondensis']KYG41307.1 hypothetical protein M433DRAFT_27669 [Acidomyces richmondensis BFW]